MDLRQAGTAHAHWECPFDQQVEWVEKWPEGDQHMDRCPHCGQNIEGLSHHYCDMKPSDPDGHGVEFGDNCLTIGICRAQDLCFGTCKLF
jgi:hypothetical protein